MIRRPLYGATNRLCCGYHYRDEYCSIVIELRDVGVTLRGFFDPPKPNGYTLTASDVGKVFYERSSFDHTGKRMPADVWPTTYFDKSPLSG